jgi:hypothetical protein
MAATLRVLTRPPVPKIVTALEELLARAKRGDVLAVAIAIETGELETGGTFAIGPQGDVAHLVCGLERLKKRLLEIT